MGALSLPASGAVYIDANCVIYAVEKVAPYDAVLAPLWQAVASGQLSLISSELIVLEALVKPMRDKNERLEAAFRAFLFDSAELRLVPVELRIIEHAARVRAATGLKAPDALHAATALDAFVALFLTNDAAFRRISGLPVALGSAGRRLRIAAEKCEYILLRSTAPRRLRSISHRSARPRTSIRRPFFSDFPPCAASLRPCAADLRPCAGQFRPRG
jgi:predicted nucleic acid-binding protein